MRNLWTGLLERIKNKQCLQSHDRLTAIRLLGWDPTDLRMDIRISVIYLASFALHPVLEGGPYADLLCDMTAKELERYQDLVRVRWGNVLDTNDHQKARKLLTELVTDAMADLTAKLEAHRARAAEDAKQKAIELSAADKPLALKLGRDVEAKTRIFRRGQSALRSTGRKWIRPESAPRKAEARARKAKSSPAGAGAGARARASVVSTS